MTELSQPASSTPIGDAIDRFVHRHQAGVWRFLRLLGCDALQAEELAQDALVIALQRRVHERDDGRAPGFLRQTAKHLWLRTQRDDRRRAARHAAAAAERIWATRLADDDGDGWLEALGACLEQLPARSRLALEQTYRDGLARRELADELGLGEHGVRNLLHRLRATLRACIERRSKP